MNAGDFELGNAVRWDTNSNKIYFNIDRWSVGGRLVLQKSADGRINMHVIKNDPTAPATVNR